MNSQVLGIVHSSWASNIYDSLASLYVSFDAMCTQHDAATTDKIVASCKLPLHQCSLHPCHDQSKHKIRAQPNISPTSTSSFLLSVFGLIFLDIKPTQGGFVISINHNIYKFVTLTLFPKYKVPLR